MDAPPWWQACAAALLALCTALGALVWRLRREVRCRHEALARLQAREAEARALAEARRRFVHYLGHEARNLVSNLSGTLWLAEQSAAAATPAPLVRALRASAQSLQDLLNSSLDNAQLDAGTFAVRPALLDVVELLQRVADETAPLARQPTVVLVLDGELPARRHWVHDGVRLAQIVRNLIANALKYGRGPRVELRAAVWPVDGGWRLCLQVIDQGPGLDEAQLARLFDEYARATDALPGVGLGLVISRRLARAMGGDLLARSERGVGSTFALRLPLQPADPLPQRTLP